MARIGIGVIGCGDIAHVRYFPSIAASPEARAIDPQRMREQQRTMAYQLAEAIVR